MFWKVLLIKRLECSRELSILRHVALPPLFCRYSAAVLPLFYRLGATFLFSSIFEQTYKMAPKATAKATPWPPAAAPSSAAATAAVGRRQPAAAPSARRKSAVAPALPNDDDDDVDEMDGDDEGEEVEVEDEEDEKEDEEEDTAVDSEGSDDSDDGSEVESDDASDHEVAQPPPAKRQATAAKPPRARSFADFQLDPRLTRALVKAKLTMPTPVQAEAIPVALQVRRYTASRQFTGPASV